jgi:hypothetical protein
MLQANHVLRRACSFVVRDSSCCISAILLLYSLFREDFIAPAATGSTAGARDYVFFLCGVVVTHVVTGVISEPESCCEVACNELRIEKKIAGLWLPASDEYELIVGKIWLGSVWNLSR